MSNSHVTNARVVARAPRAILFQRIVLVLVVMISSLSALLPSHSTAGQFVVPTLAQAATTAPGVCLLAGIADRAMDLVDGIRGAAEMQLQHVKGKKKCKSWCHRDGCGKRAHYTGAGDAERFCLQHKNATHTLIYRSRTTTSRCHILGCAKQPNFGCVMRVCVCGDREIVVGFARRLISDIPNQSSRRSLGGAALYCHTHKQLHHCNVNRPTCRWRARCVCARMPVCTHACAHTCMRVHVCVRTFMYAGLHVRLY